MPMQDFLSTSQRSALICAHRCESDRKVGDRIKAVLWADKGESISKIAELLLADEKTVRRHIKDYFENDKVDGGSGGSKGKLDEGQSARLRELLASCEVPDADDARERARKLLGVKFSISGMTAWLKRNGFSFKKSQPLPAKADPAAQAAWVEACRALKASLAQGEKVVFLDATHPAMSTRLGWSWSLRGGRESVKTHSSQLRVNVLGTLDPESMRMTTTFPPRVDGHALGVHLRKLDRAHPRPAGAKLHVVLDNGSYNRSKATAEVASKLGIELLFLPPYSPNLNLVERAWALMNELARDDVYFPDFAIFESTIKNFFQKRWRGVGPAHASRFADNFQTL
jgi:transposase